MIIGYKGWRNRLTEGLFENAHAVNPIQRKSIKEAINVLKGDLNIRAVYVYGGCLGDVCRGGDIVKLFVELVTDADMTETFNRLRLRCSFCTNYSISPALAAKILEEAVLVYDGAQDEVCPADGPEELPFL